jgi:hypothetical protein
MSDEVAIDRIIDGIAKVIYQEIRRDNPGPATRVVAKSKPAVDPDLGARIIARRDEILAENENQRTAKMEKPLSPKAAAKIARYLAEHGGRSKAPITLAKVSFLDQMADDVADEIAKSNASPTLEPNHYENMQKRLALHNQIQIDKAKGKQPRVEAAQPPGGSDDDGEELSEKIARIMKERGWGVDKFDLAASEALKEHGLGQHRDDNRPHRFSTRTETNINDEPRIPVAGANINPKAK